MFWGLFRRFVAGSSRELDLVALRHRVTALRRQLGRRPRLTCWDRLLFAALYHVRPRVLPSISIVRPETVVRWHRTGFRLFWKHKSRAGAGRPRPFAISHRHAVLANPPDKLGEYINKLGPAVAARWRRRLETTIDDEEAVAALKVYDRFLADMDATLATRSWLAGDRFSLAEVNAIPFVNRLDMLALSGMWTASRPHLTAWWERVRARAMFEGAMFKYVPAPLSTLMTEKGSEASPRVKDILSRTARA